MLRRFNDWIAVATVLSIAIVASAARAADPPPVVESKKPAVTKPPKTPWNPITKARQAARRAQSMNNMSQVVLCFRNAHLADRAFPAAFIADKDSKPLLSWRVAILPYIGQKDLYDQFKLDEPWDSEHNKKLIAKMPATYKSPSGNAAEGKTNYLAIRGNKMAFVGKDGLELSDFDDEASHTIVLAEADDDKAVEWTKPADLEPTEKDPHAGLGGLHPEGILCGYADGSVRVVPYKIDAEVLWALFTRNGGEEIPEDY